MRALTAFVLAASAAAGGALAQDGAPSSSSPAAAAPSAVEGLGLGTCAGFTEAAAVPEGQPSDHAAYVGWIDGYLSGIAATREDVFDLTPWQSSELTAAMVGRYCERRPETRFADAVNRLIQALYADRLAVPSEVVQVRANERAVVIYESVMAEVNAALTAAGYDAPAGAAFDEAGRRALIAYQTAEGLTPSGLPDQPTLFKLLVGRS